MGKLDKQLDDLVSNVGGFGDPEAADQHQREIDLLKFKIAQRGNIKAFLEKPESLGIPKAVGL